VDNYIVLACSGLGDSGHFSWSLYTFRIQSVFLLFIKYTHDYPHRSCCESCGSVAVWLCGSGTDGANGSVMGGPCVSVAGGLHGSVTGGPCDTIAGGLCDSMEGEPCGSVTGGSDGSVSGHVAH
jgi:hypothetical protein